MQNTDHKANALLAAFAGLIVTYAVSAAVLALTISAAQDVRFDLALWLAIGCSLLPWALYARNSALRARASHAREDQPVAAMNAAGTGPNVSIRRRIERGDGILNAIAGWYRRTPISDANAPMRRRAGEANGPPAFEPEMTDAEAAEFLARARMAYPAHWPPHEVAFPNDDDPMRTTKLIHEATATADQARSRWARLCGRDVAAHLTMAARGSADGQPAFQGYDFATEVPGEFVGVDEASFIPPGNGDELLVQMVQELDDMLGAAIADPAGISPESWRTIGRVWRDICIALDIEQLTYAHRAPEAWDPLPEDDTQEGE